jgi:hypothetical protein
MVQQTKVNWCVSCHTCGADSGWGSPSEVIKLWNRRELESASQPGGDDPVSGAEWMALANQAHALKAQREDSLRGNTYAEGYADAVEIAAVYINDHCIDGDIHGDAIRTMQRPQSAALSSQPVGGEAERKPIGYMNERAVSILAQGSVMCTHVSPTKTEFQQIAIYKEPV